MPAAVIGGGGVVFALGATCAWLGLLLRWSSVLTLGLLLAFAGCGVMVGDWAGLLG